MNFPQPILPGSAKRASYGWSAVVYESDRRYPHFHPTRRGLGKSAPLKLQCT